MQPDFLKVIEALILDMDGVLWRESTAIGDLPAIFNRINALGLKYMLATNNATRTPRQYVEKLASFGADVPLESIVTSSMAVAHLLHQQHPNGGPVYIVGETGLTQALEKEGFYVGEEHPLAVIASMDREVNFEKLKTATLLIRSGVPFYATNPDRTYPTPRGMIPGAGAIIGSIEIATDVKPIIAGKPNPTLYQFSLELLGSAPERTLAVGDRLETDILGGQRLGCRTALVLSGIATREDAQRHTPPPDLVTADLSALIDLFNVR